MGPGTLEAKIEPIARVERVSEIVFIRKYVGPSLQKVKYIVLPFPAKFSLIHSVTAPFFLLRQILTQKSALLVSYHIIPYAFFVASVGWITKTPYIVCQTGLQVQYKAENKFFRKILKLIFRNALQVNCPGNQSVQFWQSLFPLIQDKFKVLHSTIDTHYFIPDNAVAKLYDFIFLGRLASVKNVDLILRAFRIVLDKYKKEEPLKMAVVGDGPLKEQLIALAHDLQLNEYAHFSGFVQDPLPWLQKSRFLVMASNTEGLPTAMMQAMACHVIPVTNLAGNIPDIVIENKTGFICRNNTEADLAEAMLRAANTDKVVLQNMKKLGREKIEQEHSHHSATVKWNKIFDSLQYQHFFI
jgi:glycosyltransferase involved in cell wall biosynthesis